MRATVWSGRNTVQVENVPDPTILNDRDAIVRITSTAICGSDLHLYDGYIPTMKKGDILGHEFMGEVVETGRGVQNLAVGDRVVVPFPIACGNCWHCKHELYSTCENSNPNAGLAEKAFGHPTAGIFGYSHLTGGYAGGQAEFARVPYADVGPFKVQDGATGAMLRKLVGDIEPDLVLLVGPPPWLAPSARRAPSSTPSTTRRRLARSPPRSPPWLAR